MKSCNTSLPVISIIIPIYNAEIYLSRCIESIQKQSLQDFELILVDDGSSDDSGKICDYYALKDPRIRVIHKNNQGVSAARNDGLLYARGKYVMFADSDDYVDIDWCNSLYESICAYPDAMVLSNYCEVDSEGYIMERVAEGLFDKEINLGLNYYRLFLMGISGSPCNKIYDLNLIRNNNIYFNNNLYIGEDVDFNVQYIKQCSFFVYIHKNLYYYYTNANSATKKYNKYKLSLHLKPFAVRLPLIENNDIAAYCDHWFSFFVMNFENVFDEQCKESFLWKMRYNQCVMRSSEFRYCAEHISGKNESPIVLFIIRTYNYYLYFLFQKIHSIFVLFRRLLIRRSE